MMSPTCRPPFSPAAPFSTLETSAPRGRSSPNDSASVAFTSCTVTPMRPRETLPVFTIWSFTFSATSIGIANEMPW
jgi:hypothetical protein